jgi:hypothetical protein
MSKPEPCEACEHTHKHIVTERLTVRHPDGKSSVVAIGGKSTTGLWVSSDEGAVCVGLIFQEGVGPYLAIYNGNGLPKVALIPDGVQVPEQGGNPAQDVTVINFNDLVAAIKSLKK